MRPTINILIAVALPSWWEEMAIRRYRMYASPEAEVIGRCLTPEQQRAADAGDLLGPLVHNAMEAERKGACVHILDCFGDPQITALERNVAAPVVGVGRSTMTAASAWFDAFAVITSEPAATAEIGKNTQRYGIADKLRVCCDIGVAASEIPADRARAFARLMDVAHRLPTDVDGILLGCTELALFAPRLQEALRASGKLIEVVNSIAVAQRWAEMTVYGRGGTPFSV
jgi:allantoin racemase